MGHLQHGHLNRRGARRPQNQVQKPLGYFPESCICLDLSLCLLPPLPGRRQLIRRISPEKYQYSCDSCSFLCHCKPGSSSTEISLLLTKLSESATLRHGLLQSKHSGRGCCVPAPHTRSLTLLAGSPVNHDGHCSCREIRFDL